MSEIQEKLTENFKRASFDLGEASKAKARRDSHEKNYASAYKALVDHGMAPKLKGKYRMI